MICPHLSGHVNPASVSGRSLIRLRRGYRVTFFHVSELRSKIQAEGLDLMALGAQYYSDGMLAKSLAQMGELRCLEKGYWHINFMAVISDKSKLVERQRCHSFSKIFYFFILVAVLLNCPAWLFSQSQQALSRPILLRAAHLLDVAANRLVEPGEILVADHHITAVGSHLSPPPGVETIDLGDTTLLPGLIDAHVHLFLHPGAEDLQTVEESVPQRVILATLAARDDLMAGFTAERDMGTEGAGSADTAVRDAIDEGLIPGPRLRISGNAIDILGGHEDANRFNPEQHVLSNATRANGTAELITAIREQFKEGADFIKIYETGQETLENGRFAVPYQYSEAELRAAVEEAARVGKRVAVHASGEPGTSFAAKAGVSSIDHANQLSEETMQLMRERQIFAVPTFAISEYFAQHASTPAQGELLKQALELHAREFRNQLKAGVPMAVGSDVGPFPHGTQAHEMELMVEYGMTPANVLQADLLAGAKLLGWEGQIGQLKPGFFADVIAIHGNPLIDIGALKRVAFVMKNGTVYKK